MRSWPRTNVTSNKWMFKNKLDEDGENLFLYLVEQPRKLEATKILLVFISSKEFKLFLH